MTKIKRGKLFLNGIRSNRRFCKLHYTLIFYHIIALKQNSKSILLILILLYIYFLLAVKNFLIYKNKNIFLVIFFISICEIFILKLLLFDKHSDQILYNDAYNSWNYLQIQKNNLYTCIFNTYIFRTFLYYNKRLSYCIYNDIVH